jgi:hypothetical protein
LPLRLLQVAFAVATAASPTRTPAQASSSTARGTSPSPARRTAVTATPRATPPLSGEVADGMRAVHGKEGEPGWHLVTGRIAADDSATLQVQGIVNDEKYALNNTPRGKAYKYKVKAQFDKSSGSGERLTGRVCHFTFAR